MVVDALSRKVILSHTTICKELQQDLVKEQIELVTVLITGLRIEIIFLNKI